MNFVAALDRRWGRAYFAVQAVAGVAWWIGVAVSPGIRHLTLGELPPLWVALFDIPLFVIVSALAASGVRWSAEVVTSWTVLVTAGMSLYATVTTLAGWGALMMIAASGGSVVALLLVRRNRLPTEWIVTGPFAAQEARSAPASTHLRRTAGQIVVFWGASLGVVPAVIAAVEYRWGLRIVLPAGVQVAGMVLLALASALGLWSAVAMAGHGDGTPLPSSTARKLVVRGPYRWVRNPMAVAGIAQGVAVGLLCGSWLVVLYALSGSLVWNYLIRPWEEKDLAKRFGATYEAYRDRVSCWVPRRPRRASSSARKPLVY